MAAPELSGARAPVLPCDAFSPVVPCLRVTVWAEDLKILKPVVFAPAVAVVKRHCKRFTKPLRQPTAFTAILFKARVEKAELEVTAARLRAAVHEEVADVHGAWAWDDVTSLNGLVPTAQAEPESLCACASCEASVVRLLDRRPFKTLREPIISWRTEPSSVVGNRALTDAGQLRNLRIRVPRGHQLSHNLPGFARTTSRARFPFAPLHERMFACAADG